MNLMAAKYCQFSKYKGLFFVLTTNFQSVIWGHTQYSLLNMSYSILVKPTYLTKAQTGFWYPSLSDWCCHKQHQISFQESVKIRKLNNMLVLFAYLFRLFFNHVSSYKKHRLYQKKNTFIKISNVSIYELLRNALVMGGRNRELEQWVVYTYYVSFS